MKEKNYDTAFWIKIIITSVSVVVYGYTTFSTKDEVKTSVTELTQRLNRIENKLDSMLLNGKLNKGE